MIDHLAEELRVWKKGSDYDIMYRYSSFNAAAWEKDIDRHLELLATRPIMNWPKSYPLFCLAYWSEKCST